MRACTGWGKSGSVKKDLLGGFQILGCDAVATGFREPGWGLPSKGFMVQSM